MHHLTRPGYLFPALAIACLVSACGNTVDLRVSTSEEPGQPAVVTPAATGSVTLSWLPPVENTDGSPLVDLAGYRVYQGTSAASLSPTVRIASPGITRIVVDGLSSGTHYFAVSAFAVSGAESALSAVGSKRIP
jgi:hypothetical protein